MGMTDANWIEAVVRKENVGQARPRIDQNDS